MHFGRQVLLGRYDDIEYIAFLQSLRSRDKGGTVRSEESRAVEWCRLAGCKVKRHVGHLVRIVIRHLHDGSCFLRLATRIARLQHLRFAQADTDLRL